MAISWFVKLLKGPLADLIVGLQENPLNNKNVITSTTIDPESPFYTLLFKPYELTQDERFSLIRDTDAVSTFKEHQAEWLTMGEITQDQAYDDANNFLDHHCLETYGFNVTIFSAAQYLDHLPFTAKDYQALVSVIQKETGYLARELTFVDHFGNRTEYYGGVEDYYYPGGQWRVKDTLPNKVYTVTPTSYSK